MRPLFISTPLKLQLPKRTLDLSAPVVMGVLNVTPDSFSDGGRHASLDSAVAHAVALQAEGAAIIDVGGESTRPGAAPVSVAEELDRVVGVVERVAAEVDCVVSIDSMKPEVMDAACRAGAELINDVNALRAEGAVEVARRHRAAVCVMHMQGTVQTMQQAPHYDDVVAEVAAFLAVRVAACEQAGVPRAALLIDPGFGFGKTLAHNLRLLGRLDSFVATGLPVLVGVSRKSMFSQLLGVPADSRLHAGLAAAALAVASGARVIRTHDVRATVEAVATAQAIVAAGAAGAT